MATYTSCNPFNRSRSLWFNSIRSSFISPPRSDERGHFYFAKRGHSQFAATRKAQPLDIYEMHYLHSGCTLERWTNLMSQKTVDERIAVEKGMGTPKDLRSFIEVLQESGDLAVVEQ